MRGYRHTRPDDLADSLAIRLRDIERRLRDLERPDGSQQAMTTARVKEAEPVIAEHTTQIAAHQGSISSLQTSMGNRIAEAGRLWEAMSNRISEIGRVWTAIGITNDRIDQAWTAIDSKATQSQLSRFETSTNAALSSIRSQLNALRAAVNELGAAVGEGGSYTPPDFGDPDPGGGGRVPRPIQPDPL